MIMGNELLLGEKIRLTSVVREDLPAISDWFGNNLEMLGMLTDRAIMPYTPKQEEDWFERQRKNSDPMFAIRTLAEDRLIGTCGLMNFSWQARHTELGISVGDRNYWGKGYGSDAVRVLLRYAFMELNMNRVWLRVHGFNERGLKAYLKCGFVEEGRWRQTAFRDGQYYDTVIMAVLRREWSEA